MSATSSRETGRPSPKKSPFPKPQPLPAEKQANERNAAVERRMIDLEHALARMEERVRTLEAEKEAEQRRRRDVELELERAETDRKERAEYNRKNHDPATNPERRELFARVLAVLEIDPTISRKRLAHHLFGSDDRFTQSKTWTLLQSMERHGYLKQQAPEIRSAKVLVPSNSRTATDLKAMS